MLSHALWPQRTRAPLDVSLESQFEKAALTVTMTNLAEMVDATVAKPGKRSPYKKRN